MTDAKKTHQVTLTTHHAIGNKPFAATIDGVHYVSHDRLVSALTGLNYWRDRAERTLSLVDHDRRISELLEANNRYLQRARDAEEKLRWLPIDTAPRDETRFLVKMSNGHITVGQFRMEKYFCCDASGGRSVEPVEWRPLT